MATILELRGDRARLFEQAKELHERSVNEKRDMTADENTQYDKLIGEIDGLKAKIEREERMLAEKAELEKRDGIVRIPDGAKEERQVKEKEQEYRNAYVKFLTGGVDNTTAEERAILMERRALAVGTNTAGGYTVPQGFYNELQEAMKQYGGMRNVSKILNTASGNTLMIPTANNVAQVGAILAENTAAGTQDPSFGQTSLSAYKYTSNIILISLELIQDSAFDVESWVKARIAERIGRIQNQHFTNGTGTNQPTGIVTGAVSGSVGATGSTTSVTFDNILDLIHAVDPAYRQEGDAKFMFNDSTLKALRKIKDSYGRYLWQPGTTTGQADTIFGYQYQINQDMPQMAANAKSILFGDLDDYWIRDVMDVSMVRFGEKYMDSGQVGFVAFARADGKFINAGGNEIVYYQNSAT